MIAIIIAGGLGTRLRPLTYNRPKPVIPLVNKPFVIHQIELLKKYGINEVILNLHYLSDSIKLIFGNGQDLGVKIDYSIEESPLGTAGAVKNAQKYFKGEDIIIVFNGDVLTDINISDIINFHKKNGAQATITLTRVEDPTHYGLVMTDENARVRKFLEKPSWEHVTTNTINAGIYILNASIFNDVPANSVYSFERDLFPKLLAEDKKVFGYISDAYWLDIGSPEKYLKAHKDILTGEILVNINGEKNPNNIWIDKNSNISSDAKLNGPIILGKNVQIYSHAKINPLTVIGDSVRINEGASVENSVLLRNSIIGKDVKLHSCIIGENCIIEDYAEIGEGVVLADYSIIKKGSKLV